jgi:beta-glucosidase
MLPDIDTLSLDQQIAQMVVVRASGFLFDHQIQYPDWEPPTVTLQHWVTELGVGGVILVGGSAAELALRNQQLQEWAAIPLLLAADVEEGVGQRFSGATWFPPPMALAEIAQTDTARATQYAEQMGATIAREAEAVGLNWVLAPVVDINNNPNNPVINVRAFGESPSLVGQLTTAFIRGAQQYPVLTAAKHFPGHGDTAIDSHLDLPTLPHDWERLQTVEFLPFKAAIAAGVDAVMSAHLKIPALDNQFPATLSRRLLTEALRQHLGFTGLIVTDALVMGAIAHRYGANKAPVLAVEAGADIVLMPLDPEGAIMAIRNAVAAGRITPERIRASVERIWRAKQRVVAPSLKADFSHRWEQVPYGLEPAPFVAALAQPGSRALVGNIVRDALRVYQPQHSRLNHTKWRENFRNLILLDQATDCDYLRHNSPAIALPQQKGYQLQLVDHCSPAFPFNMVDAQHWSPTLLQLFIRGNPFRGSAGLAHTIQLWLNFLLQSDQLQALVVYGSPYVLEQFLPELPADLPYVFSYGQMPQAQAIALKALGFEA